MRLQPWNPLLPLVFVMVTCVLGQAITGAQIDVGSTGADGAFSPGANIQVDLAVQGTYDPARWAVIFNYTTVNIPSGVTVTFLNHPSRAPVVWLVQGSVTVSGTINLDGGGGVIGSYGNPGPGGFRGGMGELAGLGWDSSSGFGPGGGLQDQGDGAEHGTGATYGTLGNPPPGALVSPRYNNPAVFQLIGGSGGSAAVYRGFGAGPAGGGGGGGGAILIAANNSITIASSGRIFARGGSGLNDDVDGGAGSGGTIRLLGDVVALQTSSQMLATGGIFYYQAGDGRIRIERNNIDALLGTISPTASVGPPREVFPPAGSPSVRILMIGSVSVPSDPRANILLGSSSDVTLPTSDPTAVVIETENVPLNWRVFLRVVGATGLASDLVVTDGVTNPLQPTGGPNMQAQTSILVDLPDGYTSLIARAVDPTVIVP